MIYRTGITLLIIVLQVLMPICFTKTHQSTVGETIILQCRCNCIVSYARWRKDGRILSSGFDANTNERLSIKSEIAQGQYDLQIKDTKFTDSGEYICEIQGDDLSNVQQIVTVTVLELPTTLAGSKPHDNTFSPQEVTALQENSKTYSSFHLTTVSSKDVDTGARSDAKPYVMYIFMGCGLFAVLLLSILCNFVIHRYRHRDDIVRIETRNPDRNGQNDQRQEFNRVDDIYLHERQYDEVIDDPTFGHAHNIHVQLPLNVALPYNGMQPGSSGSLSSTENNSYLEVVASNSVQETVHELNDLDKQECGFQIQNMVQDKKDSQCQFDTDNSTKYTSLSNAVGRQCFTKPVFIGFDLASSGLIAIPSKRASCP